MYMNFLAELYVVFCVIKRIFSGIPLFKYQNYSIGLYGNLTSLVAKVESRDYY